MNLSKAAYIQGSASMIDFESLMRANRTLMHKCVQSISSIRKELAQDNKMQTTIILRIMNKLEARESDAGKKCVVKSTI